MPQSRPLWVAPVIALSWVELGRSLTIAQMAAARDNHAIEFGHQGAAGAAAHDRRRFCRGDPEAGRQQKSRGRLSKETPMTDNTSRPDYAKACLRRIESAKAQAPRSPTNCCTSTTPSIARSMRRSGTITVYSRDGTVLPHGVAVCHVWIIASGGGAIVPGLPDVGLRAVVIVGIVAVIVAGIVAVMSILGIVVGIPVVVVGIAITPPIRCVDYPALAAERMIAIMPRSIFSE